MDNHLCASSQLLADLANSCRRLYLTINSIADFALIKAQTCNLLHSLPWATEEFELANRRLENAERYVEAEEVGAARFELKLFDSMFQSAIDDQNLVAKQDDAGASVLTHSPKSLFIAGLEIRKNDSCLVQS